MTAVPAGADQLTAGFHSVPQGAAADLECSVTIRNDASTPVQVDFYVVQDQNTSACIAAGSLVFQGGGLPEQKEFPATAWNLPVGTRRWDLWFYAHGGQAFHLQSYVKPKIYKA